MTTYTVKKGDTLTSIAKKFNTTVGELVSSNGLKNPDIIYGGQVLKIPSKAVDLAKAIKECIKAIEELPEFKIVEALLNG